MSDDQEPADLEELARRAKLAERRHQALEDVGGLLSIADIAERWGVDAETVRTHRKRRDDFPEPIGTIGRSEVWTAAAIDLWRATPRKRGPKPGSRRK
ncbi:unannotated protein [freshwater metagenome]|uniref:Unannotated protein n=1 Tax=freshwater metagenome TaxID=449393 RepID=A0A6J7FEX7_9ZZZZ|nr:hypothetical protein [Actinomycetota bacterium]